MPEKAMYQEDKNNMFCQNCGKQIPENAKFCNYCGAVQMNGSSQNIQQGTQPHTEQPPLRPHPQSRSQQRQPYRQTDEKALRKYLAPYVCRNIFFVMCAITVFLLFVAPPIAVFYLAITVCFGIPWAYGYYQMNKRIASAKVDGTFERMMHEFGSSASILGDKIRYSEHYIFGKGSGRFLKYEDIYWVYRHIQRYLLIPISSTAEVGIRTGELFLFCRLKLGDKSGAGQIRELASVIYAKNPNVILGFDAKRKKEFKDRIS